MAERGRPIGQGKAASVSEKARDPHTGLEKRRCLCLAGSVDDAEIRTKTGSATLDSLLSNHAPGMAPELMNDVIRRLGTTVKSDSIAMGRAFGNSGNSLMERKNQILLIDIKA